MAYNVKNTEKEIALIERNNRGEFIKVTRIIPENKNSLESIDIRNMYTDNGGEVKPTTKGVRFNSELSPDIIAACLHSMSEEEYDETMDKLDKLKNI